MVNADSNLPPAKNKIGLFCVLKEVAEGCL